MFERGRNVSKNNDQCDENLCEQNECNMIIHYLLDTPNHENFHEGGGG